MQSSRVLGRQMLGYLRRQINSSYHRRDAFRKMYLEQPRGCVPESLLGADLVSEIKHKFYWPMDAVRRQLGATLGLTRPMFVYVDTSYEDATHALLTLDDREILVYYSRDAWEFWFEDESHVKRQLTEWYKSARRRYIQTQTREK